MRYLRGTFLLTLILFANSHSVSQELSTAVFPSEDELREAYRLGDIDSLQLVRLLEIAIHGADSASLYFLDEIPNLAHFLTDTNSFSVPLEEDQRVLFLSRDRSRSGKKQPATGYLAYKFVQHLEEEERSWYRSSGDFRLAGNYRLTFKINRALGGAERFVSRAIRFSSTGGILRRCTFGSFTARLGLGTLFGYGGKFLDFSSEIDDESFGFPDYGGYNGVHMLGRTGGVEFQTLVSVVRDQRHRLLSLGGVAGLTRGKMQPGIIAGVNSLVNRDSGQSLDIPMYALYGRYRYSDGYSVLEVGQQTGAGSGALSAVLEGRHYFGLAEVCYAAWTYDDGFIDLTSGSKAGNLRRQKTIEEVDLSYSSKRTGQNGALLKTVVETGENMMFVNSYLRAATVGDNANTHFSSALIGRFGRGLTLQIDYLGRWHCRCSGGVANDSEKNRFRLEGRFNSGQFSIRSYIAHNTETERRNFVSLFATARYDIPPNAMMQVWSNLNRLDSGGVKYWYTYVRGEQPLWSAFDASVKLAHTYRNDSSDRNVVVISFELNATI